MKYSILSLILTLLFLGHGFIGGERFPGAYLRANR